MKVIDLISSFPYQKFVVYPHLVGEPLMYQGLKNIYNRWHHFRTRIMALHQWGIVG